MDWINYTEKKGVEYIELRKETRNSTNIEVVNKNIRDLSSKESKIFSIKLIKDGKDALAYSNKENYKELIDQAIKQTKIIDKNLKLPKYKKIKKNIKTPLKISPLDISLKEKKELILSLDKRKQFPKVKSLTQYYADITKKTEFINSYGDDCNFTHTKTAYFSIAVAKDGDKQESFFKSKRKNAGFEFTNSFEKSVESSCSMAQKMLKAKLAKGGNFPVIINQILGGVYIHEAIGHASEADIVLSGGSVLQNQINKKLANQNVTIIDDGNLKEWGWTPIDDEGIKSKKTELIKKGIMKEFIHSRETAAIMKKEPTGNGRSQNASMRQIPRMTNTYLDKGDSSKKEMIESIKKGYYLIDTKGGQVSPSKGEFIFNAKYGYTIEKGEKKNLIKNVSLIGNILPSLKSISLVGKKIKFSTGTCGKNGQGAPVGDGAPHFKLEKATVGGQK